jgi:hypothetical protein
MHLRRAMTFFHPHMLNPPTEIPAYRHGEPAFEFQTIGATIRLFDVYPFWETAHVTSAGDTLFGSFAFTLSSLKRQALRGKITCPIAGIEVVAVHRRIQSDEYRVNITSVPYRAETSFFVKVHSRAFRFVLEMICGVLPVGIGVDWLLDNLPAKDEQKLKRVLECRENV